MCQDELVDFDERVSMTKEYVRVEFIDSSSSQQTSLSVPLNAQIVEILKRLRMKGFLTKAPRDTIYGLFKRTTVHLTHRQTFEDAGVQDGDEIVVKVLSPDTPLSYLEEHGSTLASFLTDKNLMPSERIRLVISDFTGTKHADVTLDPSLTAADVVERLVRANFLTESEPGQEYQVSLKFDDTIIAPNQTLANAGIQDDDVLIVGMIVRGGGGIPVRSFREIQLIEGVLNHNEMIAMVEGWALYSVILYTNEDQKLASYIRKHVRDLHNMSGHRCLFFVIEEPSPEWRLETRQYLGKLMHKYFDAVWERLGTDSFRPFEKSRAYEIARQFSIKPSQIPCIVFFSSLQSQEFLAIEINGLVDSANGTVDEFSQLFRGVFSHAQESMQLGMDTVLDDLSKRIKKEKKNQEKGTSVYRRQIASIELGASLIEAIGSVLKLFLP